MFLWMWSGSTAFEAPRYSSVEGTAMPKGISLSGVFALTFRTSRLSFGPPICDGFGGCQSVVVAA